MRYHFIQEHRGKFRVTPMCRVLGVSRSGFYDWCTRPLSERAQANRRLLSRIRVIHAHARENYGTVKTWRALLAAGELCGLNRVAKLRQAEGIYAKRLRRFRSAYAARNSEPAAPNLLDRQFAVSAPDRVWVGDITFIPTREGWLYLAVLIDLYSRRVVGWAMSERMNRQLAIDALTNSARS